MGTNYYAEFDACETCVRCRDKLHIGKSSAGWCFSLNAFPDRGIKDLPDWMDLWEKPDVRIIDEYGCEKTKEDMVLTIMARVGRSRMTDPDRRWLSENHAVLGPFGLARHKIDGLCIGHGSGTYDLMDGSREYS